MSDFEHFRLGNCSLSHLKMILKGSVKAGGQRVHVPCFHPFFPIGLFTLILAAVFPSNSGDRFTLSKLLAVILR